MSTMSRQRDFRLVPQTIHEVLYFHHPEITCQEPSKNSSTAKTRRIHPAESFCARKPPAQEHPRHEKHSVGYVHLAGFVVHQKSESAGGRHERHQARPLRPVLWEVEQQDQQRHQEGAPADPQQPGHDSDACAEGKHSEKLQPAIRHRSPWFERQPRARCLSCAKATRRKTSRKPRISPSSSAGWYQRQETRPRTPRSASPGRTTARQAGPRTFLSNRGTARRLQWAGGEPAATSLAPRAASCEGDRPTTVRAQFRRRSPSVR